MGVLREVERLGEHADDAAVTPGEMKAYQTAAAVTASRHGVEVTGWFAV